LQDFAEYLAIYSNKKYDESFRKQAGKMMLGLFIDKDVEIGIGLPGSQNENACTLQNFLDKIYNIEYNDLKLIIDYIEIAKHLQLEENERYRGRLRFSYKLYKLEVSDTMLINSSVNMANIIVTRVNKKFGADSLLIWKVFLAVIK